VRRLLVSVQVCLSLILIVTAGLFTRSLDALVTSDLGFPRERLVAVDFDVEPSGPVAMDLPALAREALDRTERLQGVVAAAMSNRAPIDSSTPAVEVAAGSGEARRLADVSFYLATARYFETVGVPIVAGRSFTRGETDSAADVAIVNETLARRLWPDGDALDRAMRLEPEGRSVRIVGIARDSRYRSISESGRPHVYLPTAPSFGRTLLVRTSGDARQALRDLQEALNEVGPGVVGFFPRTIDDHLAIELLPLRAAAGAASLLGGLALLLSAIGLYGIVSWFVEMRRREIGVRLALGATHGAVRWLVVRQAVRTAAPGMALGLLASAGIALAARSILYGIGPLHPGTYLMATTALAAIVLVASYLPSRRASLVDPVVALRSE
jgi:predicted permease